MTDSEDPLGPVPDVGLNGEADTTAEDAAPAAASAGADAASREPSASSVEELIIDLERTSAERTEYLEALRRTQADFENYRKRIMKQQSDELARAAESLVEKLFPVLDACDGAVRHGADEVEPIFASLLGTLEKEGLERIDPMGDEFDPTRHEAVMHEPSDDGSDKTIVSDVMRPGYMWKGRVVRPAMVKVRG